MNAANEAYMLQRPSSLYWCHSIKSLSCLEISSVTLTPMSSPESNLSTGLLTPPPAKPALLPPKPSEGCSIPRPRVNTLHFLFLSSPVLCLCPWSLIICCLCFSLSLLLLLHLCKKKNKTISMTFYTGREFLHETAVYRHIRHGSIFSCDTTGAHTGQQRLPTATTNHVATRYKWVITFNTLKAKHQHVLISYLVYERGGCRVLDTVEHIQSQSSEDIFPFPAFVMCICYVRVCRERLVWCRAIWSVHLRGSWLPSRYSVKAGWDAGEHLSVSDSSTLGTAGVDVNPSSPVCLIIRLSTVKIKKKKANKNSLVYVNKGFVRRGRWLSWG